MHYGIEDRSALVVGGSKGIGFEVAKYRAAEGARVAVLARTKADVDAAVETENALAYLDQHLGASSEQERRDFMLTQARVPAARMGRPEEIASLIAYLCSAPAGYLTGSWIEVDGGLHRSAF